MKMLVGLTGKTGSGKSSAAKIFENLGAYVADCDKIAHEILNDNNIKEELRNEFSDMIFDEYGNIDRKKLGAIVFSSNDRLLALNAIVHGAIVDRAIDLCEKSGKEICVLDGSELEESGAYKKCAYMIVITADDATRLCRIMKRDSISEADALLRMRAQKDYSKEAIFLDNARSLDSLQQEITTLYNKFLGEINANSYK